MNSCTALLESCLEDHFGGTLVHFAAQSGCTEGEVCLVGGKNEREGDVQICWQGMWGYVCSNYWYIEEARVLCQQLNYSSSCEGVVPQT